MRGGPAVRHDRPVGEARDAVGETGDARIADGDAVVNPDELSVVARSWTELRTRPDVLVDRLVDALSPLVAPWAAEQRARWLVDSVADLVGLLTTPSRLGERARGLAPTWPDPSSPPSFRIDGRAWLSAAREACPDWTILEDRAWRQAWLLLSDVLAEESLSPFAGY